MDRRKFLCGTAAGLAAVSSVPLWAQDVQRGQPPRVLTSVQGPYQFRFQSGLSQALAEAASAPGTQRREIIERAVQSVDDGEAVLRQRIAARDNADNPEWVRGIANAVFEHRRARRSFQRWFPQHADRSLARELTDVLVHGNEHFTLTTVWAYAAVGTASGIIWQDIVNSLSTITDGRVQLTRGANIDFDGEVTGSVRSARQGIVVHFTQAGSAVRRPPRDEKPLRSLQKSDPWNTAYYVLGGAAAGATLGTALEAGVPGPLTAAGAIIGGLIGLGAAIEGDGGGDEGGEEGGGDGDASNASGGGTSVWDGNGECPPESQPWVLC
ncbi:hypothetical protein [Hyphobacterium sp.]|uniref:hypothetical protein n=1 Tax=Hyphobacterium sp. TaxID=2004662 RepID=UPI003BAB64A0